MVMHTTPITAHSHTSRSELIDVMEQKNILAIPLVDNGIVVGLETLQEALSRPVLENPVFLMAGGFGTRLRPLTDNCPKPLLKVGGVPILETTLRRFIKAGFFNFYISTHYMPEMIRQHFGDGSQWKVKITYVHEEQPLGTGGALGLLPSTMPDLPIIMMNGDLLTTLDFNRLLEYHNSHEADVTMAVREYEYQIPYGVINSDGNKIVSMEEKPFQRFFVNAGIYVVSQRLARSVPQNHAIDMTTLIEEQIAKKQAVLMFPVHEYWLDIGRMDDFHRAQEDILALGI
jgi:NDP-sugar pyrophosphorylase family protein